MQTAKKNLENVGTAVKNAGKTFATIGTGVTAAGTAVFAFANKVTQTGDNIDKMSQKLGISAEAYQEWDFIMQHCGSTIEGLKPSMKTLANAAADGNDSTAAAFNKLGLSMDEVAAMSQEDLFATVIARLQDMGESTERTAIASDLLGRAATELGPVFNMSAAETEALRQQVHDLGGVMSNEAVKNSAAFQDSLYNVKVAFSGAANSLAAELIPGITSLMDRVSAFVADGGIQKIIDGFEKMAPVITGAVTAIVAFKAASAISGVIEAVTAAVKGSTLSFKALSAAMNTNPFVLIATVIATVTTALVTLWNTNEGFRDAVKKIWDTIKGVFIGAWDAIKAVWSTVAGFFSGVWNAIKGVFSAVKSVLTGFFSAAWNGIKGVWNAATGYFQNIWNTIKGIFSVVKSVLSGDFRGAWDAIKGIFNGWGSYFTGIWNNVKNIFKSAIDKLKSFFHFDWSLPKIKLPHFSISGKFSLSPPSIPHISVSWYKKAMDNAMLLNDPTIFGMSGNTFLGAGEAGPEVVSGADTLMNMISKSVKSAMSGAPVINITVNGANIQDDDKLAEAIAFKMQMLLDGRAAVFG